MTTVKVETLINLAVHLTSSIILDNGSIKFTSDPIDTMKIPIIKCFKQSTRKSVKVVSRKLHLIRLTMVEM